MTASKAPVCRDCQIPMEELRRFAYIDKARSSKLPDPVVIQYNCPKCQYPTDVYVD